MEPLIERAPSLTLAHQAAEGFGPAAAAHPVLSLSQWPLCAALDALAHPWLIGINVYVTLVLRPDPQAPLADAQEALRSSSTSC
jgi:hypothetical protein